MAITWLDAHGGDIGWGPVDENWHQPRTCTTVGMLAKEDEVGVTVVSSFDGDECVGGYMFIPRSVIVARSFLRDEIPEYVSNGRVGP